MRPRGTLSFLAAGLLAAQGCTPDSARSALPPPRVEVFETTAMHLDRIYTSMVGPFERIPMAAADLDWVTALRTDVIDAATGEPMGDEFLCHAQVQLPSSTRIVTVATGFPELRMPEGFGIPLGRILGAVPQQERAPTFFGMLLNNHEPDIDRYGRVRATVEYYTDEDVGSPPKLKKLFIVGMPLTVEGLEGYRPVEEPPSDDVATHCILVDGRTNHWIVPPGPQRTRKRFTNLVPVDARAHLVAVHLHNYGVYMRLTDVTTGEMLWQSDVAYEPDRLQIAKIPVYSSPEGFPIYKDHEYEVEAFYDNTTDHDVDAMAMMYLYYHPSGDEDITYPPELQS
jgi:hypothetical protein